MENNQEQQTEQEQMNNLGQEGSNNSDLNENEGDNVGQQGTNDEDYDATVSDFATGDDADEAIESDDDELDLTEDSDIGDPDGDLTADEE